jgi:hypothetical protein
MFVPTGNSLVKERREAVFLFCRFALFSYLCNVNVVSNDVHSWIYCVD